MVNRIYRSGTFLLCLLASVISVQARAQDHAAYVLGQETTVRVMDVVVAAQEYADADPERYYAQIQNLLNPLIDFRGFARKVMGPYASSERYRTLDEAGWQQLRDQLDRFTTVMRGSLVRSYSKDLLAFGGSEIELAQPKPDEAAEGDAADTSRLSVRQLIYADRKKPYEVLYQMGQEKANDWMLRNVIIENVNLGEVYRDQFLVSAREQTVT